MTKENPAGSEETRKFYDEVGWRKQDGEVVDRHLFGAKEVGPIRVELFHIPTERVRTALKLPGDRIKLLECGCGGNPSTKLLDLCSEYFGVDFSETGLAEARERLASVSIPWDLRQADVCNLPFDDNRFDAIYSAHMIYHIPDAAAQAKALQEMLRVIRPGGVLVLVTANPRPLLFPLRLLARLLADMPFAKSVARSLGRRSPLPYKPMPLGWVRRQVGASGLVTFASYGLPSTGFN